MTVGDMKKLIATLPDEFSFRMDCKSEQQEHVRSVSLECGAVVLRQHMLSIGTIVDTITAHDGVEYIITVERVTYPTVIQMPNPIHSQLQRSMDRLNEA